MARRKPDSYHAAKKKVKLERLVARYYGKLDLLAAWDGRPDADHEYIRDLKARLRTHKNDLIYRGRDVEGQLQDDGITQLHHRDLL